MLYWIWLTQIPFIGPIAARKLIEYFENAENVYKAKEKYLEKIPGLSIKQKKNVIEFRSLKEAERILENCEKQSIDIFYVGRMKDTPRGQKNQKMHRLFYTIKDTLKR